MRRKVWSIAMHKDIAKFGHVGKNCQIDESCRVFNPQFIWIGDNVRIDCFTILSAGKKGMSIGSHIHIAAGVKIYGASDLVALEDFVGIAPNVCLFTASDDYTVGYLHGPILADEFKQVKVGPVILRRNVNIGCGSVILPNVTIGFNATVGALAIVSHDVPDNGTVRATKSKYTENVRDGELATFLMDKWNKQQS
jgi:dTDP-4-amino-4,6-dideoxy-D-glucose acyltransferase